MRLANRIYQQQKRRKEKYKTHNQIDDELERKSLDEVEQQDFVTARDTYSDDRDYNPSKWMDLGVKSKTPSTSYGRDFNINEKNEKLPAKSIVDLTKNIDIDAAPTQRPQPKQEPPLVQREEVAPQREPEPERLRDIIESTTNALTADTVANKPVEESNKWYNNNLLHLLLMQAGGAMVGNMVEGADGASGGSKGGQYAIDQEIKRIDKREEFGYESALKDKQRLLKNQDSIYLAKLKNAHQLELEDKKNLGREGRLETTEFGKDTRQDKNLMSKAELLASRESGKYNRQGISESNKNKRLGVTEFGKDARQGKNLLSKAELLATREGGIAKRQTRKFLHDLKKADLNHYNKLETTAIRHGHKLEELSIGQINKLAQMTKGGEINLTRDETKHGQKLGQLDRTFFHKDKMQGKKFTHETDRDSAKHAQKLTQTDRSNYYKGQRQDKALAQDMEKFKTTNKRKDKKFNEYVKELNHDMKISSAKLGLDKKKFNQGVEEFNKRYKLAHDKFELKKNKNQHADKAVFINNKDPKITFPKKGVLKGLDKTLTRANKDKDYVATKVALSSVNAVESIIGSINYKEFNKMSKEEKHINTSSMYSAIKMLTVLGKDNRISDADVQQHENPKTYLDYAKEFYNKRVEGFAPITVKNLAATATMMRRVYAKNLKEKIVNFARNGAQLSPVQNVPAWVFRDTLSNDVGLENLERGLSNKDKFGHTIDDITGRRTHGDTETITIKDTGEQVEARFNKKTGEYDEVGE